MQKSKLESEDNLSHCIKMSILLTSQCLLQDNSLN